MNLGPYELDQIYTGDARELAKAIPDESVDLIFTDPVYDRIDDYRWLAETAARVLRQDRSLLVWTVHDYLDSIIPALSERMTYKRLFILFHSGVTVGSFVGKIFVKTTPCIWMQKGNGQPVHGIWDISVASSNRARYGEHHKWNKDPQTTTRWIEAFTMDDWITVDFFCGSGTVPAACKTLGRHYLAFEIDPDTAERARQRVQNTQPPLFVMQPEQSAFEFEIE